MKLRVLWVVAVLCGLAFAVHEVMRAETPVTDPGALHAPRSSSVGETAGKSPASPDKVRGLLGANAGQPKSAGDSAADTPPLQDPVDAALSWLVRHQSADGHWDADLLSPTDSMLDACLGEGQHIARAEVTALATLALLGNGHTTKQGKYKSAVVASIKWMTEPQVTTISAPGRARRATDLREHALITCALAEAYYHSKSPLLRTHLRRALEYLSERIRSARASSFDEAESAWAIHAFRLSEWSGMRIDRDALATLMSPAKTNSDLQVLDDAVRGGSSCGWRRMPSRREALAFALDESNSLEAELLCAMANSWRDAPDVIGEERVLLQEWRPVQRVDGCASGSWEPLSLDGMRFGRVGTTALVVLIELAETRALRPRADEH